MVKVMFILSLPVCVTPTLDIPLEFSTLLEINEHVTMYVHVRCT